MASTRLCFASSDSGGSGRRRAAFGFTGDGRGTSDRPLLRRGGGRRLLLLPGRPPEHPQARRLGCERCNSALGTRSPAVRRARRRRRRLRRRVGPARRSRAGEHVRPDRRARRDPAVESTPGRGTTVRANIPVDDATTQREDRRPGSPAWSRRRRDGVPRSGPTSRSTTPPRRELVPSPPPALRVAAADVREAPPGGVIERLARGAPARCSRARSRSARSGARRNAPRST